MEHARVDTPQVVVEVRPDDATAQLGLDGDTQVRKVRAAALDIDAVRGEMHEQGEDADALRSEMARALVVVALIVFARLVL